MTTTVRSHPTRGTGPRSASLLPSQRLWTSGWTLLPLRLFLGVTFMFAGLQKLADPHFLDPSAPSSIQAQLHAATRSSPIGGLLGGLAHQATLVGVVIALAELAVGTGALLGLWTRAAAVGGVALSLGFLLTVSWHSHPYYLGPDIVFAAAWVPLVLAGAGDDPRLSLDARLRQRTATALRLPPAQAVPVAFATVQQLCGGYEHGRCSYRHGQPCGPEHCPVLAMPAVPAPATADELDRRTFLHQARIAGLLVVGGALASGLTVGVGRFLAGTGNGGSPVAALPSTGSSGSNGTSGSNSSDSTGSGSSASATPSGVSIGSASAVPVGGVASFDDPGTGSLAYVVQPTAGQFAAFSSVCPHAGCQVQYSSGADEFVCPCHGARFDGTGQLLDGPARRSLDTITIHPASDGQLYVDS